MYINRRSSGSHRCKQRRRRRLRRRRSRLSFHRSRLRRRRHSRHRKALRWWRIRWMSPICMQGPRRPGLPSSSGGVARLLAATCSPTSTFTGRARSYLWRVANDLWSSSTASLRRLWSRAVTRCVCVCVCLCVCVPIYIYIYLCVCAYTHTPTHTHTHTPGAAVAWGRHVQADPHPQLSPHNRARS